MLAHRQPRNMSYWKITYKDKLSLRFSWAKDQVTVFIHEDCIDEYFEFENVVMIRGRLGFRKRPQIMSDFLPEGAKLTNEKIVYV